MRIAILLLMLAIVHTSKACDNLFLLKNHGYTQNLTKTYSAVSLNFRKAVLAKWDFGDGSKGSGKTVNHTFATEGKYLITLYAYDSVAGCWDTVTYEDCALDVATTVTPKGSSIEFSIPSKPRRSVSWFVYSGNKYNYFTNPASHPVANGMPRIVQLTYYDTVLGCGNTDSVDVSSLNPASRKTWNQAQIRIWPQPTSGFVHFQLNGDLKLLRFEIFNLQGQQMVSQPYMAASQSGVINLTDLPCGVYVLQALTSGGMVQGKIAVER